MDAFGRWLEREGFKPARSDREKDRRDRRPGGGSDSRGRRTGRALAGETITYDWILRSRRGVHHMQTTLSPLRSSTGEVTGIVGVGRDISHRVEAGRELQRWARIFEHAGWGVAIVSADGETIESVNPAFALMHGWTVDELRGRPMADLSPPGRADEFLEKDAAPRRTRSSDLGDRARAPERRHVSRLDRRHRGEGSARAA